MAPPLLHSFIPKTVAVIRLSSWKLDGQNFIIIKRGVSAVPKKSSVNKGRGQRINGNNTIEKNSTDGTFADQKTANINTEGKVFDATAKKTTGAVNN